MFSYTDAPVGKARQIASATASGCPATNWWSLGLSVIAGKCNNYTTGDAMSTKIFPGLWSSQLNRTTCRTTKYIPVVVTKGFVDHPFPVRIPEFDTQSS